MANWRGFTYEGSPRNRTKTAPLDTYQAWGLMLLHYEQLADVVASCSVVGSQPEWRPDESDQKSLRTPQSCAFKNEDFGKRVLWCGRSQSTPANSRRREDKATSAAPAPHCLLAATWYFFKTLSLYPANMQTGEWNSLRCNGQLFFVVTFVSVRPLELFVV